MSEKKIALVTGGASGIGAACCRSLAAANFRIGIHFRNSEEAAQRLCESLPDAFCLGADLCDELAIDSMVAELRKHTKQLDVLVNNAGDNRNGLTPVMKLADYDAVAALNRGTWYLTKLILRRFMLRQQQASIINISSVVGHTGNAGQVPYTMAKAGIDAFTKSLAQELAGRPIRVNSVAPGFIETAMTESLGDEVRSHITERIPLKRMGRPDEVAEVVRWLATEASYVHGSVIHVNGGMYSG